MVLVSVVLKYRGLISVIFHNFSNKFELEILSSKLKIDVSLRNKINSGQPVVAIETAILTHGMPIEPGNQFVKLAFNACKQHGVSPAFLSVVNGALRIGASEKELSALVNNPDSKSGKSVLSCMDLSRFLCSQAFPARSWEAENVTLSESERRSLLVLSWTFWSR